MKPANEKSGLKWQRAKKPENCAICGRISRFKYYNVQSCEGCKQFFRRVVMKKTQLCCQSMGRCDVTKVKCRGCRWDKCLQMGMDPSYVQAEMQIGSTNLAISGVDSGNGAIIQGELEMSIANPTGGYRQFLNMLVPLECAYRQIWESNRPLPDAFLQRHNSIEGVLEDGENLLANYCEFEELDLHGILCPTNMALITKDWFLSVEMAKSMPHFEKLQIGDKIILLKHIYGVISLFMGAFFSYSNGAKTLTRANGHIFIAALELEKFKTDKQIHSAGYTIFCELIGKMDAAGIEYEEFLLLFAIITASSTADSLSPQGRDILYNESVQYSLALQKFMITKFGHFAGMKKFMASLNLVESAFRAKRMYDEFVVYYEVFYQRSNPMELVPKALHFCFAS